MIDSPRVRGETKAGYWREYQPGDELNLAQTMRKADIIEVRRSHGLGPLEALEYSVQHSDECYSMFLPDGTIIGMYGCGGVDILGVPWMLGTDHLLKVAKPFLLRCHQFVDRWNERYPILFNYVDAENKTAQRWLRFLGFTFIRLVPDHGIEKTPFYEFVRIKSNV